MNLIEQLGGYEKSKRELKLKEEGSMFQCCTAITEDMIRDALLEHRRENDIYEVGDLVVLRKHDCHALYVYAVLHSNDCATLSNGESYDFALIRHASDKEIAQGYRDE